MHIVTFTFCSRLVSDNTHFYSNLVKTLSVYWYRFLWTLQRIWAGRRGCYVIFSRVLTIQRPLIQEKNRLYITTRYQVRQDIIQRPLFGRLFTRNYRNWTSAGKQVLSLNITQCRYYHLLNYEITLPFITMVGCAEFEFSIAVFCANLKLIMI